MSSTGDSHSTYVDIQSLCGIKITYGWDSAGGAAGILKKLLWRASNKKEKDGTLWLWGSGGWPGIDLHCWGLTCICIYAPREKLIVVTWQNQFSVGVMSKCVLIQDKKTISWVLSPALYRKCTWICNALRLKAQSCFFSRSPNSCPRVSFGKLLLFFDVLMVAASVWGNESNRNGDAFLTGVWRPWKRSFAVTDFFYGYVPSSQ